LGLCHASCIADGIFSPGFMPLPEAERLSWVRHHLSLAHWRCQHGFPTQRYRCKLMARPVQLHIAASIQRAPRAIARRTGPYRRTR